MNTNASIEGGTMPLSEEHRMLLRMRDTLYEGSWTDFVHDLNARTTDRPHVFATVPESHGMRTTIERHLSLISDMVDWERLHELVLGADAASPADQTRLRSEPH